jgi:hypothetical protein
MPALTSPANLSCLLDVPPARQLYIGNLISTVEERDLDDVFGKFGKVESIWIARKPPGCHYTFRPPGLASPLPATVVQFCLRHV